MEPNQAYTAEMLEMIQSFVDRVDQALIAAGMPRVQRNNVCDEVESQIHLMIERRIEAGSEQNAELVTSVIESMDPPESYSRQFETASDSKTQNQSDNVSASKSTNGSISGSTFTTAFGTRIPGFWRSIVDRLTSQEPHVDPVAVAGLGLVGLGAVLSPFGIAARSEGMTVLGFFFVFLGAIASGVSYWRIRNSRGNLLGKRFASAGILVLPLLVGNTLLVSVLIATGLWLVLGTAAVIAAFLYGNYRLIRKAVQWLERDTIQTDVPCATSTPPIPPSSELPFTEPSPIA
jgi:hypothetical protein